MFSRLARDVKDRVEQLSLRMTNTTRIRDHLDDVAARLNDLVSHSVNTSNKANEVMNTNKVNKEKLYEVKVNRNDFIRKKTYRYGKILFMVSS